MLIIMIGYTGDMFDKYHGNSTNDSSVNSRIWNLKLGYSQFSSSFWLPPLVNIQCDWILFSDFSLFSIQLLGTPIYGNNGNPDIFDIF